MTHIFVLSEGFSEGIESFWEAAESNCIYKLTEGSKEEIGKKAGISVREVRLWDVTVKECNKEEFLRELRAISPLAILEEDQGRGADGHVYHGVGNTRLKIGAIRRTIQWIASRIGFKPLDMNNYEPKINPRLQEYFKKNPLHGYILPLAEIPDGKLRYNKSGSYKNVGRENT